MRRPLHRNVILLLPWDLDVSTPIVMTERLRSWSSLLAASLWRCSIILISYIISLIIWWKRELKASLFSATATSPKFASEISFRNLCSSRIIGRFNTREFFSGVKNFGDGRSAINTRIRGKNTFRKWVSISSKIFRAFLRLNPEKQGRNGGKCGAAKF